MEIFLAFAKNLLIIHKFVKISNFRNFLKTRRHQIIFIQHLFFLESSYRQAISNISKISRKTIHLIPSSSKHSKFARIEIKFPLCQGYQLLLKSRTRPIRLIPFYNILSYCVASLFIHLPLSLPLSLRCVLSPLSLLIFPPISIFFPLIAHRFRSFSSFVDSSPILTFLTANRHIRKREVVHASRQRKHRGIQENTVSKEETMHHFAIPFLRVTRSFDSSCLKICHLDSNTHFRSF